MSLDLIHNQPPPAVERRVIRIQADAIALSNLDAAQLRAIYSKLEAARDRLSLLLDRADGKHA